MTGNLIDRQVQTYQQNNARFSPKSSPFRSMANIQKPSNTEKTDSFESDSVKKEPNFLACILGSWLGVNWLSDAFNRSCSNENYDKTIMGRLGNLGDKISKKADNNPILQKIDNFVGNKKAKLNTYINKSPLLSGIFNTPTKPECSQVLGFMETQHDADLKEAYNIMDKYVNEIPQSFKEVNATNEEIQALKAKYGTGLFGGIKHKKKALMELQFNRLGAPENYIDTLTPDKVTNTLKEMKIIKGLGFADKATFEAMKKNPENFGDEILQACKQGGKEIKVMFNRTPLLKRSGNLGASTNKLLAETAHSTKLGKFLAKIPKILHRGLTFGGGRYNALFVAFGLGMAVKNAIIAPKKQKVATAVGGGVDAMSWIVSMPLAIKAMFGLNGMKYAGMGANVNEQKANVQAYRDALKVFNADQQAGLLNDKAIYESRLKDLNKLKEAKIPLNKFQSFMKKFSDKFLSIGLEVPRPYQAPLKGLTGKALNSARMGNFKSMASFMFKNGAAYPLRFAAYMFLFQPVVDKAISTCTNALFGKPYEAPEETENKNEERPQEQPIVKDNNFDTTQQVKQNNIPVNVNTLSNNNLIKQKSMGKKIMHPHDSSKDNNENNLYIPSDECLIQDTSEKDLAQVLADRARTQEEIKKFHH